MRRRYHRTTDLRPYVYPGILLAAIMILGGAIGSFAIVAIGLTCLIADVLLYGWLVAGWRFRPASPANEAALPAPRPNRSPAVTPPRRQPSNPDLQSAIYNLQSPDPRLARLMQMSGVEFERFVGERIFRKLGYAVDYTPTTSDGGIDLLIRKQGEAAVVQCKRYVAAVSAEEVYAFNGALSKGSYERGYFITTSRFSAQTRQWVRGTNIALIDGERLLEWLDYIAAKGL
jgi:Restriction endonuclease